MAKRGKKVKAPSGMEKRFLAAFGPLVAEGEQPLVAAQQVCKELKLRKPPEEWLASPVVGHFLSTQRRALSPLDIVLSPPTTRDERLSLLADIERGVNVYKTDHRLRAIDMAMKANGDYVERKEIKAAILHKNVQEMSDEELAAIIASEEDV